MNITILIFNTIVVLVYILSLIVLAFGMYSTTIFKEQYSKILALVTSFNMFSAIFWVTTLLAKKFNLIYCPEFILEIVKLFSLLFFIAYILIIFEICIKKIQEKRKN